MTLLAPAALWGLLALGVPLLLHLRRRRVGRTIQVGSLKHLETLPTAERRGPRVRDPLRLLLRLAILALVVLTLADPVLPTHGEGPRSVVLVDQGATPELRDSLAALGELLPFELSSPWEAIARADDSLPPGVDLIVAAPNTSDRFEGPRPVVARSMRWIPIGPFQRAPGTQLPSLTLGTSPAPNTPAETRALAAAVLAVVAELGPLSDTAHWQGRLPTWWRDSLGSPAFPIAVARAIAPARSRPAPVRLAATQILPRSVQGATAGDAARSLHWWLWGAALLLLVMERLWARKLESDR